MGTHWEPHHSQKQTDVNMMVRLAGDEPRIGVEKAMAAKGDNIPALKPGVDIKQPDEPQPDIDAATRRMYLDSLPKTVQIVTDHGLGSGFFMDKEGRIGTAGHVVLGSSEQFAIASDGTRYKLQIEKLDDVNDAAILRPVGFKPGSHAIAEMGSSRDLKLNQPIFPMGHPNGLRPAYISPGTFQERLTEQQLLEKLDPKIDMNAKIAEGLKNIPAVELPEMKAALQRYLLSAHVHIRPGDSGGPTFDANGKVVGLNDMIHGYEQGYFVPVEKIRDLYNNNDSKFQFNYARIAEPWAQDYKTTWDQKPLSALTETMGAGGLGYVGYRVMSNYPKSLGFGASAIEGLRLLNDDSNLLNSTDNLDKLKYGIASAADLTGAISGLAFMTSRYRVGGAIGLAVGIGARLAADFVPTHLVLTDIQNKHNPLLPPLNPNIEKSLGIN